MKLKNKLIILPYRYIKKKVIDFRRERARPILNDGERYDPNIGRKIDWTDKCHIARYAFAQNHISKDDSVLDIACGTGYGTYELSKRCKEIVGIDISDDAINYAKKHYKSKNITFIVSDLMKNDIIKDIVVSFETIEHVKVEKLEDVLIKLSSFCKKKLIGSVPYKEKSGNNPHHFFFNLDEKDIKPIERYGEIKFFYQNKEGDIFEKVEENKIQNLIFILEKRRELK